MANDTQMENYQADDGETWQGDRKVDQAAGPDSLAGKLRQRRLLMEGKCTSDMEAAGMCRRDTRDIEPSRAPRDDIYGPSSQQD